MKTFEQFINDDKFSIISFTNDKKFINKDIFELDVCKDYFYKNESVFNIIKDNTNKKTYFVIVVLKNTKQVVGYFWKSEYKEQSEYFNKFMGRYETDENYRKQGISKLFTKQMLFFLKKMYGTVFFTNLKSLKTQISSGAKIIDSDNHYQPDFYFIVGDKKIKFDNYKEVTNMLKNNELKNIILECNGKKYQNIHDNWNEIKIPIDGKYVLLIQ